MFLFNLSIDDFEAYSPDVVDSAPFGMPVTYPAPGAPQDSPFSPEPVARDQRHAPPFIPELIRVLKYVDDNVLIEKLNFDTIRTDGYLFRLKHAIRTQNGFRRIVHQAESVGMKVHPGKP